MIVAAAQNEYGTLFVWSLILVAVVVVGFIVVVWVKRRIQQPDSAPTLGFSLADLRELHRTGKISDEEFERARGKMAASLKHQSTQKPKKPD
jgi:uncharacterized membrane protein